MANTPKTLQRDVALAPLTTLGVGGAAKHYVRATTLAQLEEALHWARQQKLAVHVLGGGSNCVISDAGLSGLVLQPALGAWTIQTSGDVATVEAGAGVVWDDLVAHLCEAGFAGMECLSGIPGWVGAAPIQNIGAYGQEVADTITQVTGIDQHTGAKHSIATDACGFAYRSSHFKARWKNRYVVTQVRFTLHRRAPTITYGDLVKHFAGAPAPSLCQVREAVLHIRRSKSMVIDANDANSRSVGSFFVNPVLSAKSFERLCATMEAGVMIPAHRVAQGYKLSAAWLIEHAGFPKGFVHGNAGLSSRHALAIVNRGNARSAEILDLANTIVQGVQARFGICLEREPVLLSDAGSKSSLVRKPETN